MLHSLNVISKYQSSVLFLKPSNARQMEQNAHLGKNNGGMLFILPLLKIKAFFTNVFLYTVYGQLQGWTV